MLGCCVFLTEKFIFGRARNSLFSSRKGGGSLENFSFCLALRGVILMMSRGSWPKSSADLVCQLITFTDFWGGLINLHVFWMFTIGLTALLGCQHVGKCWAGFVNPSLIARLYHVVPVFIPCYYYFVGNPPINSRDFAKSGVDISKHKSI